MGRKNFKEGINWSIKHLYLTYMNIMWMTRNVLIVSPVIRKNVGVEGLFMQNLMWIGQT